MPDVGAQLIARGWVQGSLIAGSAIRMTFLKQELFASDPPDGPTNWIAGEVDLQGTDLLVVVSQTCDIKRAPEQERFVEAMRAFWTTDSQVIYNASRNSTRSFLLRRRQTSTGEEEGLIANATFRVHLEKSSLLALAPAPGFEDGDDEKPIRFSRWLGERYSRRAVPDGLVLAVQKPIVEGIRRASNAEHQRLLEGVREILFLPLSSTAPYDVEFLFIEEDECPPGTRLNGEERARLAGWLDGLLRANGSAKIVSWNFYTPKTISVYDYTQAIDLPLDYYSPLGS